MRNFLGLSLGSLFLLSSFLAGPAVYAQESLTPAAPASSVVDQVDLGSPSVESTVRKELERSGLILERSLSLPQAEAGPDKFALVGQQVIFDASLSRISLGVSEPAFKWEFGDGSFGEGLRVIHIYENAGHYKAKLTVKVGEYQTSDEQIVSIFERQVVLLSDESLSTQQLTDINAKIRNYQTDIKSIRLVEAYPTSFLAKEAMARKILVNRSLFVDASFILSYGLAGIEALQQVSQQLELNLSNKRIIIISKDVPLPFGSGTYADFLFEQLRPQSMVFISEGTDLSSLIQKGEVPADAVEILPDEAPWAFLSFLRGQLSKLVARGFPLSSVLFLFFLLSASIICLAVKRIIGFSDIDVFTTTLAITAIVYLGVIPGILIFMLLALVSALIHVGLYLNQLALLPWNLAKYLGIALATIFGFLLLSFFYPQLVVSEIVFPILVISFSAEAFAFRMVSGGIGTVVNYLGQEISVLLVGSLLLSWELLGWFALAFPGIYLIVLLLLGIMLEHYRGLRLTELRRFRNILVEE